MLRTLSKYKKEYKSETDEDEKKKIHGKIADYTQKWLDAKNLQLGGTLHINELSTKK